MKMLDPKRVVDQMETEFQAGAASRDAEIAELQAEIASLKESLRLACEIREGTSMGEQRLLYWEQLQSKLAATETELAAALAACKSKDEAIREGLETYKVPMTARIVEALAIQPDDSALKAWLGEPVAWEFTDAFGTHYTDAQRDWMDTPGIESVTPLYSPKGLK
jgi:hypothetical protein